ncbi:MAG TPA: glycosyltransferase family 2 protein [Acidimicrobiales bacterium]
MSHPVIDRPGGTRRIAVVPAFDEEPTVASVLDKLSFFVDELVVVDDGSTDGTRDVVKAWLPGHDHCRMLWFDENQGMSAAYHLAFTSLRTRLHRGELHEDDLVLTVAADGRHDLDVVDDLHRIAVDEGLDALLVRRDLSGHPWHERLRNRLLSAWATLWAGGVRFHDVTSGYRLLRLGALCDALEHYEGYKYSETVEVAVVLSRLGCRVRNDVLVPVPVHRSRTRPIDTVIDLIAIPMAAYRVSRAWRASVDHPDDDSEGPDVPGLVRPVAVTLGGLLAGALGAGWAVGRLARALRGRRRRGTES